MQQPIYLDYMATTPVDPGVISAMMGCLGQGGAFGNPASVTHSYGFQAQEKVDRARMQVANAVQAHPSEIVFTSGATEANNLAIKGVASFYQRQGRHLITSLTEHKAVLDVFRFLETQGFSVTYLKPDNNGLIDLNQLADAICSETILVSIMQVNNETGVIQNIQEITNIVKQTGAKLHVDGAQSVGRIPIDVKALGVDLMSFSAHKAYGPKGIGALYVSASPRTRLTPLHHGGGQEFGVRSGTLATHQIVGMGAAFSLAVEEGAQRSESISHISAAFMKALSTVPGITINGEGAPRVPHCLNLRFSGVDADALIAALPMLAMSSGSACNAARAEPSHVLLSMGLNRYEAQSSLRISFGRYTQMEDAMTAAHLLKQQLERLRSASPIWQRVKNRLEPDHHE